MIPDDKIKEICKKFNIELIKSSFLGAGAHNQNFLLETNRRKLVLRIGNNPDQDTIEREYNILKMLKGKFGPKVYYLDTSKNIIPYAFLIEEFFEGKAINELDEKKIKDLAKLHKLLHKYETEQLPDFISKNYYSLTESLNYHGYERYKRIEKEIPPNIRDKVNAPLEDFKKIVKQNEFLFKKRKKFQLMQEDCSRSNVFYVNGKMKLIDWEFARYDIKEWEIVFCFWTNEFTQEERNLYLSVYGDLNKKELKMSYLMICFGMLSWRIQRYVLMKKGKIHDNNVRDTDKNILPRIYEDLGRFKDALKDVNKLS